MSEWGCPHELHERETAVADGMCPLCDSADLQTAKAERDELMDALLQSVLLQSHYADLLNMQDGGKRIVFKSADEWLARLRSLAKRMQTPVPASSP